MNDISRLLVLPATNGEELNQLKQALWLATDGFSSLDLFVFPYADILQREELVQILKTCKLENPHVYIPPESEDIVKAAAPYDRLGTFTNRKRDAIYSDYYREAVEKGIQYLIFPSIEECVFINHSLYLRGSQIGFENKYRLNPPALIGIDKKHFAIATKEEIVYYHNSKVNVTL